MNFRKATLQGLDMSEADLTEADFRDAILERCSLREANLTHAQFKGADLRGCDLGPIALADAPLFKGAIISKAQASELLQGFGIRVA